MISARAWRQALWLSLVSIAFVAPQLWRVRTNIVTDTYRDAARDVVAGTSPYGAPAPGRDVYKYSPVAALLFAPFTWLGERACALTWLALNALAFWLGVGCWCRISSRAPLWIFAALVATAMELDISLRYQQVNALLTGLTLAGIAAYRDSRLGAAGILLGAASALKVLPAAFLGALLYPFRPRYLRGVLVALALALILPLLWLGTARAIGLHTQWFHLLAADSTAGGLLDLKSLLRVIGVSRTLATPVCLIVAGLSAFGLLATRIFRSEFLPWGAWASLGLLSLLLLSPRTESPTFVLGAPAYLLLTLNAFTERPAAKRVTLVLVAVAAFLVTVSYTDAWPKAIWSPHPYRGFPKTVGTLVLWGVSLRVLLRTWWRRRSVEQW